MRVLSKDYFIQQQSYAFGEPTLQYWNNDRLNPYVRNDDKPFNWMRADAVGGRSLLWGRQVYRWSEQDFRSNALDGNGVPWPVHQVEPRARQRGPQTLGPFDQADALGLA